MASITDLAIHLSTGRCIAWVGSGPSIEMGLPSWRGLANDILETCRKEQRRGFQAIEALYRDSKYPEMLDQVEMSYGRTFLNEHCQKLLQDPGGMSSAYETLASLGFLAYFTTNYDDVLFRHINQAGRSLIKYLNSADDLAAVDVDVTPALIKLHGDFSDPTSTILTRSDYRRWYRSGEGNGFRVFLRSFLARDRFLFVGYSMSDPEVLQLQEEVQADLRRKVRSIAILANVPDHEIDRWRVDYNIDILPYRVIGHDHSELSAILASIDKVLSVGQVPKDIDTAEELKRAEALYLWYRFTAGHGETPSGETPAVNALQSVVLNLLVDSPDAMTLESLRRQVASKIGAQAAVYEADLEDSLNRLVDLGWIVSSEGRYAVEPENQKIIRVYERRFEDMMATFNGQVAMDAIKLFGLDEATGTRFAQLYLDTLIDFFQSRGREILKIVFEESAISPSGALDLIETVWKHSSHLHDHAERPLFVRFVLETMFEPKGVYEVVLNYFAKAFFSIQALGANQAINRIVSNVIADRALLIDANVLIPLTAKHEDRHQFITAVIDVCGSAGIRLYATKSTLDEVKRHARWALNLTRQFGPLSPEVLYAATGQGDYEANAYLKGFVTVDPNHRDRSFQLYLDDCFGGSFASSRFDKFFPDKLNITVLDEESLDETKRRHKEGFDWAASQISQWDSRRIEEERKNPLRIESEAEAFIAVTQWNTLRNLMGLEAGSKCSYLTYGTTVGRLGATSTGSSKMLSVQPGVMWEVLTTLGNRPDASLPEFGSLMSASYFRMADHFIDKERYRTFFRPVIDAAKTKLQDMHPFVQEVLGVELTDEYLEGYATEDLPALLSSVQNAASRKASSEESTARRLIDENESLRSQLWEYQEREAKRREFVARQRQRDKERKSRRGRS